MRIETIATVNTDGSLDLHLQTGLRPSEVRVMILIEPKDHPPKIHTPPDKGWPENYFEQFYGALTDEDLEEPEELSYEKRTLLD